MRVAFVVLAVAVGGLSAGGCYMRPGEAPQPTMSASTPAASSPSAEVANLPDFRPETAAACNAVRLSVAIATDGSLGVNGAAVDLAGLKAAAAKKNDACQYVAAAVNLAIAPGVPDKRADEIRDVLAGTIKNLALIE